MSLPVTYAESVHLANAAYKVLEEAADYVQEHCPRWKVVKQVDLNNNWFPLKIIGTWKVTTVENRLTGDRVALIEGTSSVRNWIGNLIHGVFDCDAIANKVFKELSRQQASSGKKFVAIIGHSAGGYIGSEIIEWHMPFINGFFFNNPHASEHPGIYNFCSDGDPVSAVFSNRNHMIKVPFAEEGHGISNFLPTTSLEFHQFVDRIPKPEAPPQTEPIAPPVQELAPEKTVVTAVKHPSVKEKNGQKQETESWALKSPYREIVAGGVGFVLAAGVIEKAVIGKRKITRKHKLAVRISGIAGAVFSTYLGFRFRQSMLRIGLASFGSSIAAAVFTRWVRI